MNGYLPPNGVVRPPAMSLDEQQAAFIQQAAQNAANHVRPGPPSFAPNGFNLAGAVPPQMGMSPLPPSLVGAPPPGAAFTPQQQQQALLARNQQNAAVAARAAHPGATPSPAPVPAQQTSINAPTDGGPPYAVPIYPLFTRINALEPGVPFPAMDADEQQRVKQWMDRDLGYERELLAVKKGRKAETQDVSDEVARRQDWLGGEGRPTSRVRVRMEDDRRKERATGKRGKNRSEIKLSKEELRAIAKAQEILIPIRLEYEHESFKLRDTFTWNLRDPFITPEIFASHLCEDLRLPHHPFFKEVIGQIKRHIEEAQMSEQFAAHLGDQLLAVREDNRQWLESGAHKRKKLWPTLNEDGDDPMDADEEGEGGDEILKVQDFLPQVGLNEELRVMIKLDITLDNVQLVDKFEWDLSDARNSPEDFAETFSIDLGLSGEFRTAIAHAIREQLDVYIKSLCILGYTQGSAVPDEDLRREFLPSLAESIRTDPADFTPLLNQLTPEEVERNDKEREREVRRKRRQTKGRGITLPDRDFVKTHRTLVPKPSTAPIQPYTDHRGELVYPAPEMSLPYEIVPPVQIAKPHNLETVAASPLKLVPVVAHPPPAPETSKPAINNANRFKKKNADGTYGDPPSGSVTPAGASPFPGESAAATSKQRKAAVNLEELGLHEHMIHGKWHCANCGVPESAAVGRRKGQSGINSLCGACGKYFHRFRRNRPCTYTTDLATHQKTRAEVEAAVAAATKVVAGSPRKANSSATTEDGIASRSSRRGNTSGTPSRARTVRDSSEEPDSTQGGDHSDNDSTKGRARGQSPDLPFVQAGSPGSDMSSVSSSTSPPPVAAQFGNFPRTTASTESAIPSSSQRASGPTSASPAVTAPPPPAVLPPPEPLPWMVAAAADLRAKQVDDRFEIIPRPRPPDPSLQEWRIRCLDCPGKLYNLGPGETLDNFSVHFKNRVHRGNVDARLKVSQTGAT